MHLKTHLKHAFLKCILNAYKMHMKNAFKYAFLKCVLKIHVLNAFLNAFSKAFLKCILKNGFKMNFRCIEKMHLYMHF